MKSVFVDTAALIALGNRRDDFHGPARTVRRTLIGGGYTFVTTRLVIVELCNAFSRGELRGTAAQIVESIEQSSRWTIIEADRQWITAGFDLYRRMTDKEWGLVDCVSILVAQHFEIQDVFTTDHHFERAGFRILLQQTARTIWPCRIMPAKFFMDLAKTNPTSPWCCWSLPERSSSTNWRGIG